MNDSATAIEALQSMEQWMLDNGADEDATRNSVNIIERELRKLQAMEK